MCFPGANDLAEQQYQEEKIAEHSRKQQIAKGMGSIFTAFRNYTPEYYDRRRKDFLALNMPTLDALFRRGRDKLTFALARSGNLAGGKPSSAAVGQSADLRRAFDAKRQALVGESFDFSQNEQRNIESTRSGLVNELRATTDPTAAARASQIATGYRESIPTSDFSNLFANVGGAVSDYVNPPVDWNAFTRQVLNPSSGVRVVK